MNYKEAMEYMDSLNQYGIVPGLGNIERLCNKLGNPQEQLKFIHISGTNGKGSTLAYISTIYKEAGYRVGRYISPTIFDYKERFQINGKPITQVQFCSLLERVKQACNALLVEGYPHPTPFEVDTALAFLYFAEKACDLVVLETGMGGLEDATNIVRNTVCAVIASISMDHMQFLGKRIEDIALQKAGIIKDKCMVVALRQKPEVENILRKTAAVKKAKLVFVDKDKAKNVKLGLKKQSFSYGGFKQLEITMAGTYQIANALLAVEVVEQLKKTFPITQEALRQGLKNTTWPGRFYVARQKPLFILDGAHNEDACLQLKASMEAYLEKYIEENKLILIMGVLRDKDYEKMVELICPYSACVITVTPPNNSRALSSYELAKTVQKVQSNVTAVDSLEEALEAVDLLSDKSYACLAFGSLSYLGPLIKLIEKKETTRK